MSGFKSFEMMLMSFIGEIVVCLLFMSCKYFVEFLTSKSYYGHYFFQWFYYDQSSFDRRIMCKTYW